VTSPRIGDDVLAKVPAFHGLNAGEQHQMLEIARAKSFAPGEKIIEQGKSSQYLWVVLEGRCQVVRDSQADGSVVLAQLEPYQLFGEMSFFSPAPHSASVIAKSKVSVLSIARSDYDDMVRDGVSAAYKLAYNIVENVAAKLRHMDERLAELAGKAADDDESSHREWRTFREKVFHGWNL
jgi:CRP/FNR family cyclic AMP-dependent transcriptional regulator